MKNLSAAFCFLGCFGSVAIAQSVDPATAITTLADIGDGIKRIVGLFGSDPATRTQQDLDHIRDQTDQIAQRLVALSNDLRSMEVRIIESGRQNFVSFVSSSVNGDLKTFQNDLHALQLINQDKGIFSKIATLDTRKAILKTLAQDFRTLQKDAAVAEQYGDALMPTVLLLALSADDAAKASGLAEVQRAPFLQASVSYLEGVLDQKVNGSIGARIQALNQERASLNKAFTEIDSRLLGDVYHWSGNPGHEAEQWPALMPDGYPDCESQNPLRRAAVYYGYFKFISKASDGTYRIWNSAPERRELAHVCVNVQEDEGGHMSFQTDPGALKVGASGTWYGVAPFAVYIPAKGNTAAYGSVVLDWNKGVTRFHEIDNELQQLQSAAAAVNTVTLEFQSRLKTFKI